MKAKLTGAEYLALNEFGLRKFGLVTFGNDGVTCLNLRILKHINIRFLYMLYTTGTFNVTLTWQPFSQLSRTAPVFLPATYTCDRRFIDELDIVTRSIAKAFQTLTSQSLSLLPLSVPPPTLFL